MIAQVEATVLGMRFAHQPNGMKYLSYHNLFFVQGVLEQSREAIRADRFEKFQSSFLKKYN